MSFSRPNPMSDLARQEREGQQRLQEVRENTDMIAQMNRDAKSQAEERLAKQNSDAVKDAVEALQIQGGFKILVRGTTPGSAIEPHGLRVTGLPQVGSFIRSDDRPTCRVEAVSFDANNSERGAVIPTVWVAVVSDSEIPDYLKSSG